MDSFNTEPSGLNSNFFSHFFWQLVFTVSRKWSEGLDPFKESRKFEILLLSLSGLLLASATFNNEFISCLVELLSLTLVFYLVETLFLNRLCYAFLGDLYFVAQTKHMVLRSKLFVVGIMDTVSITHLTITFETA